jgi:hypothetical protein
VVAHIELPDAQVNLVAWVIELQTRDALAAGEDAGPEDLAKLTL